MRCTIGTTVVMTGLVVAMLAFRPPVIDDPSMVQAQGEGTKGKSATGKEGSPRGEKIASSDSAARQRLQNTKIGGEFSDTTVRDALSYLSDTIGVQFHIDKQSLENASINNDTPVSLQLQNVPAEMLLDLILRQANLGYRLRNGVILVASAEDVQSQTEVRVYRVPDGMAEELAALIPDTIDAQLWSGHTVTTDSRGRRRAGYGSMGGPARGGYGGTGSGGYGGGGPSEGDVSDTVGGGGGGTIRVFRGTLVVSQTPEIHQKIEKLLDDLTGAGAMEPQRRPEGIGAERTSHLLPGGPPQDAVPGERGYGQTGYGRGGYGGTGYGQANPEGRGGYGGTGSIRGGYGATRGGAADRPKYGQEPTSSPSPAGAADQPPDSSGLFAPEAGSPGATPSPTRAGGTGPSPSDPNAAGPGSASFPGGPPGLGTGGGVPPGATGSGSATSPAAEQPRAAPAGGYGGAR